MTILNNGGSWARGCAYTVIDDQPREPKPETVMSWFLKLSETTVINVLDKETKQGTMTQRKANNILTGYCKKKLTYNAYEKEI
jgi:hypothetical protein